MAMTSNTTILFASTCLAQKSFSGKSRPSAAILNAVMDDSATDGFGSVNIERSTMFFKKLPADVNTEALAKYEQTNQANLSIKIDSEEED